MYLLRRADAGLPNNSGRSFNNCYLTLKHSVGIDLARSTWHLWGEYVSLIANRRLYYERPDAPREVISYAVAPRVCGMKSPR